MRSRPSRRPPPSTERARAELAHADLRMEPLSSHVVATGGNRSQIRSTRKPHKQAKSVATSCHQLRPEAHGKERVAGSSPSEGSAKAPPPALSRSGRLAQRRACGGYGAVYGAFKLRTPPPALVLKFSSEDRFAGERAVGADQIPERPWARRPAPVRLDRRRQPSFDLYGGGGLVSTVDDLTRFYRAL